jgi:hypothetical protein
MSFRVIARDVGYVAAVLGAEPRHHEPQVVSVFEDPLDRHIHQVGAQLFTAFEGVKSLRRSDRPDWSGSAIRYTPEPLTPRYVIERSGH